LGQDLVYTMVEHRKKIHITTFGCQMNEYDSERIVRILAPMGYEPTENEREADVIFVNTCSIRHKAEQKVYSHLGRLQTLKKRNPDLIVAVGGCVAQQYGKKLLDRIGHLDLVCGTQALSRLPEMIREVGDSHVRLSCTDYTYHFDPDEVLMPFKIPSVKSFLTIMTGCNNFCTYCIVPYVRGREISRLKIDVEREAQALVESGIKEITLLGQNVNSYCSGDNGDNFVTLLRDLNQIDGLCRIRFTTSHPKDLSAELIQAFGEIEKLCPHIHLPVQSGSDRILRMMNRSYSRQDYMDKVGRLRDVCPHISITTDLIVGFPGETEQDFDSTLDLMQEVEFDGAFSFKYSDRPHAKASGFTPKVPEAIKSERLARLQTLQEQIGLDRNKRLEGKTELILVEGRAKKTSDTMTGRTGGNHVVNFPGGDDLIGHMVPVFLEKSLSHSIRGWMLGTE
jgi:tRNA-2-methylthio-N6-dimethylallyladenosine synthase